MNLLEAKQKLESSSFPGKTVTNCKIDYREFETWFKSLFGKQLCICSTEEAGNDSTLSFEGIGEHPDWTDDEEYEEIEAFVLGDKPMPQYQLRSLLEYLCNHKFIPAGNYLISIYW